MNDVSTSEEPASAATTAAAAAATSVQETEMVDADDLSDDELALGADDGRESDHIDSDEDMQDGEEVRLAEVPRSSS